MGDSGKRGLRPRGRVTERLWPCLPTGEEPTCGAPLRSAPAARSTGRPNIQGIPGRGGAATWAARPQSPPPAAAAAPQRPFRGRGRFLERLPEELGPVPELRVPRPVRSRCAGDGTLTPLWDGCPQPSA